MFEQPAARLQLPYVSIYYHNVRRSTVKGAGFSRAQPTVRVKLRFSIGRNSGRPRLGGARMHPAFECPSREALLQIGDPIERQPAGGVGGIVDDLLRGGEIGRASCRARSRICGVVGLLINKT